MKQPKCLYRLCTNRIIKKHARYCCPSHRKLDYQQVYFPKKGVKIRL